MPKHTQSRGTLSPGVLLSIGALALGIICTVWALVNINAQTVLSAATYHGTSSSSTTAVVEKIRVSVNDAIKPEPVLPAPAPGDTIGSLSIPVLKQEIPIIEGTGTKELKKGVGHFIGSVLPGVSDNCVLSAHRDTYFANLGKVKVGDQLIVKTVIASYTYEVSEIRIVDKDDRTVIVPKDHGVLTLSTCYPFDFVGSAPDRYIVSADLVVGQ
ncbi:MAG: class D sortase [Actinobacteria bacterium HGW-Actinobacteria-6]|jgi:sortase A|nr:MAG: class D sortase [Actinobacteria bacterium HGW-Actinobacteria-6]